MAEESIFSKKELSFLEALNLFKVDYIIIGLSAATLQGAPVVTQDVDLWFKNLEDPNLRKALDKVSGIYVPPFGHNPPMFTGSSLELFDIVLNPSGLGSFDDELKNTININLENVSVRILKLERIIENKKAANRPKDRLAIPVLEDTLEVLKK